MKLKIGYITPLPPVQSGVAYYASFLIPYLARLTEITLFITNDVEADLWSQYGHIKPLNELHDCWSKYDVLIYHMGNSAYHSEVYRYAMMYSGIVVLHDYSLHHFIEHQRSETPQNYLREMVYDNGREGIKRAWRVLRDHEAVDFFSAPLCKRLIDSQRGIIVHSRYVENLINGHSGSIPVCTIPLPNTVQIQNKIDGVLPEPFSRADIGLPHDSFVIVAAGNITVNKQIPFLLEVIARLHSDHLPVFLLMIGALDTISSRLNDIIQLLALESRVIQIGYVEETKTFLRWIRTADVLVNLRYPTLGETSGVVLQGLALGVPTIVFDHGW